MADLARLLRPRTIAAFGGKAAAELVRQNQRMGFDGEIWPVHPRHDEVAGLKAYRSVADLPGAPDASFVGVNRHLTIDVVRALAERGAGGAVCYASGFSESGAEGAALQAELLQVAGAMPVVGPNCYGMINYLDGTLLWPDQHGGRRVERGVAIVTQSGNIGLNLTMQRRGLPVGYLVTLGNQARVGLSDMIEALSLDPRVTAIGLHIEAIDDPAGFAEAARNARRRGTPIVALKTGKSEAGAALTVSHTASLAGADAVVDAFLAKVGVVRVKSIPVMLESLKLLHLVGPLNGRDIASMSCSGGEAALIADAEIGSGLRFRTLTKPQAQAVADTLTELVTISNPLDYHNFSWADEAALTETFAAMMAAEFDLTLLLLDYPREDRCKAADWEAASNALIAASRRTGRKAGVVATVPEGLPEERALALAAGGVVPLLGIDDALAAIAAGAQAGAWRETEILPPPPRRMPAPPPNPTPQAGEGCSPSPAAAGEGRGGGVGAAGLSLTEWEAKQALAAFGLPVPDGRLVDTPGQAASVAESLGFPVALKAVGKAIAHKTEMGAVKLNLKDAGAVEAASVFLLGMGEGLLVERMVIDPVAELIVGVNRDPAFGLHLVVGSGGVLVELVGDSRLLLLPASRHEIAEAIRSLKVAKLLAGYRGKPAGDLDAAVDAVLAIQSFVLAHAGRLLELDVNPLMVTTSGAVAADALIRFAEESMQ